MNHIISNQAIPKVQLFGFVFYKYHTARTAKKQPTVCQKQFYAKKQGVESPAKRPTPQHLSSTLQILYKFYKLLISFKLTFLFLVFF